MFAWLSRTLHRLWNATLALIGRLRPTGGPSPQRTAAVTDQPAVFDPYQLLTLNLAVDPPDWEAVRHDLDFDLKVPAQLWADGEEPILVSVRRKSATALPSEADPQKVSLKIDVNAYVAGQLWRDLNKLSLENGDDTDVVAEGLAWHLHEIAAPIYGYDAAHAAWVRVNVNGQYVGLYLSVEQRDKQFLRNRGLYQSGSTWLYKLEDRSKVDLEVGDPDSPTFLALCYLPFQIGSRSPECQTPSDAALATDLGARVDMRGMLTLGAVDAFIDNPDSLFSHAKNAFFADFATQPRRYYPWDLDSVFRGTYANIYARDFGSGKGKLAYTQTPYQQIILNHPAFRRQFNEIMLELLAGPFQESNLHAFLDQVEPLLTDALVSDPNSKLASPELVTTRFSALRGWLSRRTTYVRSLVEANNTPAPRG